MARQPLNKHLSYNRPHEFKEVVNIRITGAASFYQNAQPPTLFVFGRIVDHYSVHP